MIQTAKSIIDSIPNIGKEKINDKKARRPAHEFQAFAYKIAADFNDLSNLKIYMNILKKVERIIIEQAYTYTIDTQSEDKKKVFFWKIKQLRREVQLAKDSKNYDWKFVLEKMKKFRNSFYKSTIAKFGDPNEFVSFLLYYFVSEFNQKILVFGLPSTTLIQYCNKVNSRIYFYDISKAVRKEFMINLSRHLISAKEMTWKDPLAEKGRMSKFDIIIIDSIFSIVPVDFQQIFFKRLKEMTHINTIIYINITTSIKTSQEWRKLEDGRIEHYYFIKKISPEDLKVILESFKVNILEIQENENSIFLKFSFLQY